MLGQGFTEDLLGAATGLPLPEIEDALRQAVDHNILRATAGELRFRHDLMREAIYDDLLPAQRHRLHIAVAAAIEADETIIDPAGARWGVLALHWKSAGDRARALGASIQAARWASLVGAPSEAADHLETALALWEQTPPGSHPDGTDRAALLEQAAEARFSASQALRARTLAEAAATELADSTDVERVALAHAQVGVYSRVAGEAVASAEAFQRAVGLLADRPPSPAKAVVMARYAGFLMVGQRVRQGLAAVEAALDLARRTGSRSVQGHALCTKGVLTGEVGRLEEGLRLLHDSCEIAREVGQAQDLARAFQDLTYIQLFAGLADEALATADAGLQVARRLGTMLSSGIGITEHQAERPSGSAGGTTRSPSSTPSLTMPSKAPPWSVSPPPASTYSSGAVNLTQRHARWRPRWNELLPWTMPSSAPTPGSGPRSWLSPQATSTTPEPTSQRPWRSRTAATT